MRADDFKKKLDTNFNLQLIVAGMAGLVEEGNSPREVFELLEATKQNTFHALSEIRRENNEGPNGSPAD